MVKPSSPHKNLPFAPSLNETDSSLGTLASRRSHISDCKHEVKMMLPACHPTVKAADSKLSLVGLWISISS